MTDADPASPESFEAALDRLEDIVRSLESGQLPLDHALEVFEEGVRLSRFCHGKLDQAERKVELLLKDGGDGKVRTVPFKASPPDRE